MEGTRHTLNVTLAKPLLSMGGWENKQTNKPTSPATCNCHLSWKTGESQVGKNAETGDCPGSCDRALPPKCCHGQLQERGEYRQLHKEGKSPQRQRWESGKHSSLERQGWTLPLSVQRSLVLPTPELPGDPSLGLWSLELLYLVPSQQ